MIVFTVMYPHGPDKHFDMDYYLAKHIPLVREKVGDALKGVTVDKGLSSREPGSAPTYAAITRLLFDTVEDVATRMTPHSPMFNEDIPNFTNIKPFVQVSEVIV